jgi:hypothetical protein
LSRKPYPNNTEEKFACLAESNGWRVTKRGWPDFLCFGPDGEIIAVEVKPRISGRKHGILKLLSREQVAVMDMLKAAGVRCFVSDGDKLEPYDRDLHGPKSRRRWGSGWHKRHKKVTKPPGHKGNAYLENYKQREGAQPLLHLRARKT